MLYWPKQPDTFPAMPTSDTTSVASQMLMLSVALLPSTMPAKMYTAEPGTGGNMNIRTLMINTSAKTISVAKLLRTPLSRERKTKVHLPPSSSTTKRMPRKHTFARMPFQFHLLNSKTILWPCSVKISCVWDAPLSNLNLCRNKSINKKIGTTSAHTGVATARTRSELYPLMLYLIKSDFSQYAMRTTCGTSKRMKASKPKQAMQEKTRNALSNSGDEPAT
mmetsp:Transcript_69354/g.201166  ORF Transcript_69354/g.201166 Transcript_69354/m.201166 type:complete len:221 (-) Transcript_69354:2009-2671(-)